MKDKKSVLYTVGEEIFNSVSHGVGVLLSVAALTLLIVFAVIRSDGYGLASAIVFGVSLILLYSMSTVYHIVSGLAAKRVLRIFDHCSIFILIAGTYTPYLLMCMRNALGWTMFGLIWGVTVLGIILNAIDLEKFEKLSLMCYIAMGWAIVFSIKQLVATVPTVGIVLLVVGGVTYTIGAVLYGIGKKMKYMHSVFHFLALGGSVLHFISIYAFVL